MVSLVTFGHISLFRKLYNYSVYCRAEEHKRQVNVCKGMIVGVKEGEKVKQINLTNIIKERDMEITTLKW